MNMMNPITIGKEIRRFKTKDGRAVVFRTPKWEDLDDLLEVINSLIEEVADIEYDTKKTREEEIDWLSKTLASLEKKKAFHLVAEVDSKVIASSAITKRDFSCENHVGRLGIIIKSGYRDIGIGTEMMKAIINQAKLMGVKILTLTVFATNICYQ